MKRPFVVCHMLASLDGKIDGAFFGAPEIVPAIAAYGKLRGFYHCQATVYGTTTMLGGYADGKAPEFPEDSGHSEKIGTCGHVGEDYVNEDGKAVGNFIVSMDPQGILGFHSNIIEKKGRPATHVIEVLTEQVSAAYLAYLQQTGVSYVFAGKDRVNGTELLRKLRELFGIDRLMIAGGGVTNWFFLQEGLIDELSLVIAPVADGSNTAVSIFEQAGFLSKGSPVPFSFLEAKPLDGNALWLRYRCDAAEQQERECLGTVQ